MTDTSAPRAAAGVGALPAIAVAPASAERRRYDRSIIEGPLRRRLEIAWPTMLTNIVGGLQGIVDHALVGHPWASQATPRSA